MWKRPQAGGGVGVVLTGHGADARGPLLCGRARMDHKSDSVWIEPLEATALSTDEEAKIQTSVFVEGHVRRTERRDFAFFAALGVQVTIIDRAERPLQFFDAELVQTFVQSFEQKGGCYCGGQ